MKKLLMFLLLGIFLFSLASVSALQFDNIKQIKEIGKTNYPNIEIKNAFGLGQRLARIELEEHQETCGQFCDSIMLITLDEDSVLIDDAWTLKKENGEWIKRDIRKLEFYINTEDKFIEVDDYETQCEVTGRSKNGTEIKNCQRVKVGSHKEKSPTWTKYNLGEEVKKGIYEVKVVGEKKPSWEVDWIIETQGEILDELAVWENNTVLEGLIAYYKMDDNLPTISVEDIFLNHAGYLNGGDNTEDLSNEGKINLSLNLDGSSDYINLTNTGDLSYENMSLQVWVNTTDTDGIIISKMETGNGVEYSLSFSSGNIVGDYRQSSSGAITSPLNYADGNWHHIVLVGIKE